MVTDDRQEVVGGDLGHALLGQERPQVQPFQGEGDVAVDLEGIHHLVPEALQVDAKDLKDQAQRTPKGSFATGALGAQHISACLIFAGVLCLSLMNPAGSSAYTEKVSSDLNTGLCHQKVCWLYSTSGLLTFSVAARRELGNKVLLPTSGSRRTLQYFTPFRSLREEKKRTMRTLQQRHGWVLPALESKNSSGIVQAEVIAKYLTTVQRNKVSETKLQTCNTTQKCQLTSYTVHSCTCCPLQRKKRAIMQLLRAHEADTATSPDSAEKAD